MKQIFLRKKLFNQNSPSGAKLFELLGIIYLLRKLPIDLKKRIE